MNVLVISDIHANLIALEAVLADAEGQYEAVWCLGDLVGYGPDPDACVQRVKALPGLRCVRGNHDAAVLDDIDVGAFNREARFTVQWTYHHLSGDSFDFLEALPEVVRVGEVTLTHGSPREPVWEYILDRHTATLNFRYLATPFCFVGHTHLPVVYMRQGGRGVARKVIPEEGESIALEGDMILNPGSVGQPRDSDPRAAYALFDTESLVWTFRRVAYDIPTVQERMREYGLPERHIVRLEGGW